METEDLQTDPAGQAVPDVESMPEGGRGDQDALISERDQLVRDKTELQDRILRLQAEFDNFRRRQQRERAEYQEFAGMDTTRGILPLLDDLERAIKMTPAETPGSEVLKGMGLIHGRFLEALKKNGVEPVESVGKQFDPHVHEAVERVEQEDAEDGTVLEEYQKGYQYRGKLLRPAMVKVAVKQ